MRRLIARRFAFVEDAYDQMVFSDTSKVGLDRNWAAISLRPTKGVSPATGIKFPTDKNLHAKTPLVSPDAVRKWVDFMPTTSEHQIRGTQKTFVRYRINDGTQDLYWDGANWSTAGTSDWNTAQELQDNLGNFDATNTRQLRLVVNLETQEETLTPRVTDLLLFYEVDIGSFIDEWILRTLQPQLRSNVQPAMPARMTWPGGDTADLSTDLTLDGDVTISDVEAAFDHTSGPNHFDNLVDSYTAATNTLKLTQSVSQGNEVHLELNLEPTVALDTHPDWKEVPQLPAIMLDEPREINVIDDAQKASAVNVGSIEMRQLRSPRKIDLEIPLSLHAHKTTLLLNMNDLLKQWVRRQGTLESGALDEQVEMQLLGPTSHPTRSDMSSEKSSNMSLILRGVREWLHPEESGKGVQTLKFSLDTLED